MHYRRSTRKSGSGTVDLRDRARPFRHRLGRDRGDNCAAPAGSPACPTFDGRPGRRALVITAPVGMIMFIGLAVTASGTPPTLIGRRPLSASPDGKASL